MTEVVVADLTIDGLGRLAEVAEDADSTVVLLYRPEDCFTCYGVIPAWSEWAQIHSDRFKFILTREPDEPEARQMVLYRIEVHHVLVESEDVSRLQTPREILLVDGVVVFDEVLRPNTVHSALLAQLVGDRVLTDPERPNANESGN